MAMAFSKPSFCLCLLILSVIASLSGYVSATATNSAGEAESKEFVVTLDHSNFTDFVANNKFIVVEFYAPWCGHCKKLAPEYEKAASILSSSDPHIVLAKVDANEQNNKPIANEYEIRGFPTLKILRHGGSVVQDYKGPRDANGIVNYLKKQSGPASTEIKSPEVVTSVIESDKILVVGVFQDFSGEMFENFTSVAERLRDDYEFGHTIDAKLLPDGDLSASGPFVRLFKPFDERVVNFQEFDVEALVKFVQETSIPTVTLFDKDPKHHPFVTKYFNSPNDKAMLFLSFSAEQFDAFESVYRNVAQQYKGEGISFLMGDTEASQGAFQYFGIKDEQVPLIIIQKSDGEKYFKPNVMPTQIESWVKDEQVPLIIIQKSDGEKYFKPNVMPTQIESWVKDFKDGIVQPYKKSEPIPEVNNEPVKVVVADSLQDIVFNSGKNVLLEFYAPWCGHCKNLAPILDEVAVSFQNDPDVVIAKIDATANDIPRDTFEIKGYPTLYFKSASGSVSQYDGGRTKEDIIEFIQKNIATASKQESGKEEL